MDMDEEYTPGLDVEIDEDVYGSDEEEDSEDLEIELDEELAEELAELTGEAQDADADGDAATGSQGTTQNRRQGTIRAALAGGTTLVDLARLLGFQITDINAQAEDEEDEEDESQYTSGHRSWESSAPTEPQKEGVDLLMSGEFGRVGCKIRSRRKYTTRNVSRMLRNSGSKQRPLQREDVAQEVLPNSNGTAVSSCEANVYCGQYSADASFYYTCAQDFKLRVYDTTKPLSQHLPDSSQWRRFRLQGQDDDPGHQTRMKMIKTIQGQPGRWTITDSHLSPDNERMIYSSITSIVWMCNTRDSSPTQTPINFSDQRAHRGQIWDYERFGIWSCRFSADGNEVIAGGSGKIFVYDLLSDQRTVKIMAHDDDVNSCCWADTASGNVLVSASDDTFLKVWDRRSLGMSQKPAGVLVGHTEGITNVAPRGDGRYIISNGKDQTLRLWDLRKMCSSADFDKLPNKLYGVRNYDYRYGFYPKPRYQAHPNDCSVMAYRGHAVLRTLIRCHFSPVETTGAQYVYSGSSDGRIHIWSLDGRIVEILDRSQTQPISFDPSGPVLPRGGRRADHDICVRDVSWHSREPVMLSAGWEGRAGGSVVARHEWKGASKMMQVRGGLEDFVAGRRQEAAERRTLPGGFGSDDE